MRPTLTRVLLLAAALVLTACSRPAGTASPAAPATEGPAAAGHAEALPAGIDWFKGTVDEAFAYAKAHHKPIFLYWGAVWCPPCHEVKATVFRSHAFIDRSKLFVPVYLDGDTENAQKYGEKFGVVGYPTMIVFSPQGEEITRIPGGIDIQAYANVLDLSLAGLQPVSGLLASVLDKGSQLSADQCRLMAYYSWEQNPKLLEGRNHSEVFDKLAAACPAADDVDRSILQVAALEPLVDAANDKDKPVPLTAAARKHGLALVNAVLDDPAKVRANLFTVLIAGPDIVRAVTAPGSAERAALQARFLAELDRLGRDDSVFLTERLYTEIGKIRFARIDDLKAPLPAALQQEIRDRVQQADEQTRDVFVRQTVINAAANVLDEADMTDDARKLLTAELGKSREPYYFMVDLAGIEKKAGNDKAAIDWYRKAYAAARGPATRFQWGYYYVNGLIALTPDDVAGIRQATVDVVNELKEGGSFYQRPKAELQRLQKKLEDWGKTADRKAALKWIREQVQPVCAGIPEKEPARATCEGFLAG